MVTAFTSNAGQFVWSRNTGNIDSDIDSIASPPSIANDTIYGGTRSISALQTLDGSVRWQYTLPDNLFANAVPLVNGGKVSIGAGFISQDLSHRQLDQLIALDAATGNKLWTFPFQKEYLRGDLTVGDGVVVSRYEGTAPDGAISAGLNIVDAQNGKLLWQKDLDTFTPLSIANGLLYVLADIPSNRTDAIRDFYAFDIHTGAVRWSLIKETDLDDAFVVAHSILYTANSTGEIRAIDALTGQLLWHAQLEMNSTPARPVRLSLSEKELFVGTEIFPPTSNHERYFCMP